MSFNNRRFRNSTPYHGFHAGREPLWDSPGEGRFNPLNTVFQDVGWTFESITGSPTKTSYTTEQDYGNLKYGPSVNGYFTKIVCAPGASAKLKSPWIRINPQKSYISAFDFIMWGANNNPTAKLQIGYEFSTDKVSVDLNSRGLGVLSESPFSSIYSDYGSFIPLFTIDPVREFKTPGGKYSMTGNNNINNRWLNFYGGDIRSELWPTLYDFFTFSRFPNVLVFGRSWADKDTTPAQYPMDTLSVDLDNALLETPILPILGPFSISRVDTTTTFFARLVVSLDNDSAIEPLRTNTSSVAVYNASIYPALDLP